MSFIVEGNFSSPASLAEGEGVRGREEVSASAAMGIKDKGLKTY